MEGAGSSVGDMLGGEPVTGCSIGPLKVDLDLIGGGGPGGGA